MIEDWKDNRNIENIVSARQVSISHFLSKGVRLDRFI